MLTDITFDGPNEYTAKYRGYTLVWGEMACYIWYGSDWIETHYGPSDSSVPAAMLTVDAYMIAR